MNTAVVNFLTRWHKVPRKSMKMGLVSKGIQILDRPACFPDMNLMENQWTILTQKVYANNYQFPGVKDLMELLFDEWNKIDLKFLVWWFGVHNNHRFI